MRSTTGDSCFSTNSTYLAASRRLAQRRRSPSYAREPCVGCARASRGRRWRQACRARCTSGGEGSRAGAYDSSTAIGAIPSETRGGRHGCAMRRPPPAASSLRTRIQPILFVIVLFVLLFCSPVVALSTQLSNVFVFFFLCFCGIRLLSAVPLPSHLPLPSVDKFLQSPKLVKQTPCQFLRCRDDAEFDGFMNAHS